MRSRACGSVFLPSHQSRCHSHIHFCIYSSGQCHSHIYFCIYSLFRPVPLPNSLLSCLSLLSLPLFNSKATHSSADTLYQCHYYTINYFVLLLYKYSLRRTTPSLSSLLLLRASLMSIRSLHLRRFIHLHVGVFILLLLPFPFIPSYFTKARTLTNLDTIPVPLPLLLHRHP
jgi:hypothetical protein